MAEQDGFDPNTVLNQGVISRAARGRERNAAEQTLLITGLARSGTSMLAGMLQSAGIWLGDHVYEPINEDAEIAQMLRARDFARLDALIARHNAKAPVWGFKMPDLHQFLQHDELSRFVDNVLDFCGIALDEAGRTGLLQHVQPNRAQYVLTANRTFEGIVEGVLEGRLYGWARHVGNLMPLLLDLLIDDTLAATFQAGEFRDDLLAANLGNGNHAFFLDLGDLDVTDSSVVRIRVNGRTFELANSGMSLAELKALRETR